MYNHIIQYNEIFQYKYIYDDLYDDIDIVFIKEIESKKRKRNEEF